MERIDISIIIATRNRERILWETIEKACVAIKDKNAEIIVVNDGDFPLVVPDQFSNKIIYLNNPKRGVSSARNFGASNAKGTIFFFADDDMWINSEIIDWINVFIIDQENTDAVYNINWEYPAALKEKLHKSKIGKYILTASYNTMWGRMHQKGIQPTNSLYPFTSVASCSLVMSKNIFEKTGGYNEGMIFQGEDIDLSNKLNSMHIPIYCVFDTTLFHNHQDRLDINAFLKRDADGFNSEFKAIKHGFLKPSASLNYNLVKKLIFDFFLSTEKGWIILLKNIPDNKWLTPINNKLIGVLASLQKYKQWKKIIPG
ncbi:MAG: glycosyltransferase family 2 protein [Ginsengibacter sp.]